MSDNESEIQRHTLPPDRSGEITWFDRQNTFEQAVIRRQVSFRQKHWPHLPDGQHSKYPNRTYPHILPSGNETLAFYAPIALPILDYLAEAKIALHTEALNLKSSQVACFNFLFPFRQNTELATSVFQRFFAGQSVGCVTNIEFEYTTPDIAAWLGEPKRGKRGQNRTSIDAAIFWESPMGQKHVALIEWKYTEHNFGLCSAFSKARGLEREPCLKLNVTVQPEKTCLLTQGGDNRSRRYWEHFNLAGIVPSKFAQIVGCPFHGPFFQLMRQFLIAAYLREHGGYQVEVISLSFAGNQDLHVV